MSTDKYSHGSLNLRKNNNRETFKNALARHHYSSPLLVTIYCPDPHKYSDRLLTFHADMFYTDRTGPNQKFSTFDMCIFD